MCALAAASVHRTVAFRWVRVRLPAPRSHADFDRVGVGFFFLIFGELPIYPVILEQIRHIRICSLKCSRYSLNDFSLLRLPNRGNRLSNTEKRSANRQNPIVRSANCWVNKKTKQIPLIVPVYWTVGVLES